MPRFAPLVPLLGLSLLGCSAPNTAAPHGTLPEELGVPPLPGALTTTAPPSPDASPSPGGTDLQDCYEAQCEISVSEPVRFPVDPRVGYDTIAISQINAHTVSVKATGQGNTSTLTVSPGGTSWFNGLGLRVLRVSDGTAVLKFLR